MPDLPLIRREQFGVFTSAQARDCGWTRHQIQRLLDSGEVRALRRGVYVERRCYDAASPAERAMACAVAACLARPGSVISHHSAALIHGLPLLGTRPARPSVTYPPSELRRSGRDRATFVRSAPMPPGHVDVHGLWRVTSALRTACDIARAQSVLSGLVAADAALSRGLGTNALLSVVCDQCATWPGSRPLRDVAQLANGHSESPYETVARWQLSTLGYTVIPQVWAFDDVGPVGCGDLWLPHLWVFVEIDGDVKYAPDAPADSLLDEKLRQERFEIAGFGVARVAARDTRNASLLTERVTRAAERGRLARRSVQQVTGFVGPPPPWARRGTAITVTQPPPNDRRAL